MKLIRQSLALLLVSWMPSFSLAQMSGNISVKGHAQFGNINAPFFALLNTKWVNAGLTSGTGECPTSGFAATKTMKATGGDYTPTFAQLKQAKTDQVSANQHWLLVVDVGTNLHGSTFDGNNALVTMPTGGASTKCLVVRSSNHNIDNATVCGTVYPTVRDQNCTNSAGKFWKITIDSSPQPGNIGLYIPPGPSYVVLEDVEIAPAPMSAQSQAGVNVSIGLSVDGDHFGTAYSWYHGWNPGDAGQTGTCTAWTKTGTVNTSGTAVTWVSGDQFGPDFSDGTHSSFGTVSYPQATINVNGTNVLISSHDPAVSATSLTVASSLGVQTGVAFTMTNPATVYATGCGDDFRGVQFNGNYDWMEFSQVNKVHWWNSESHAVSFGFSAGPLKFAWNYIESGSGGMFSGGGPIDSRGGPLNDVEIGSSYIGRDLNWRFLSAGSGNSPAPPFGCGPLDGVAAHDTCPFKWSMKNNIELKECNRCLIYGVIIDGDWADGQSGYPILLTPRTASGGSTAGIYDPTTGLPLTILQNIRYESCWVKNVPQIIQISSRSLSPGNGGGVSAPFQNFDMVNCLFTNVGDNNQFGGPGPDIAQWSASGQVFLATLSRTGGVAHAVVSPMKIANFDPGTNNVGTFKNAFDVTSVVRSGTTVTMKLNSLRHDPTVGGQIVIAGVAGWNGTFTISGVLNTNVSTLCTKDNAGNTVATGSAFATQPQPCVKSDGTFGDAITYTDSQGGSGTLCSSLSTCNATGIQATMDTLAYKIADISVGDGLYVHNCSGGSLGNPTLFQVGATSRTAAIVPTSPTGDVYYANAGSDDSGVSCQLENSAGLPANTTFQHNTVLASKVMSIGSNGIASQHFQNQFFSNVFAMPSGNNAVLTDSDVGGQGTAVYAAWDSGTFKFYDQIMQGRTSGQWSVSPSGSAVNAFPTTVTCSGATADATCLGYSSYMSGVSFPNSACTFDGSNALNCPLMSAPWSTNFDLSKILPVATSSYASQGVNLTTLQNAFTATQYTCPAGAGASCTPFPD